MDHDKQIKAAVKIEVDDEVSLHPQTKMRGEPKVIADVLEVMARDKRFSEATMSDIRSGVKRILLALNLTAEHAPLDPAFYGVSMSSELSPLLSK